MDKSKTILINRNDSKCWNCGEGATFDEKSHTRVLGYGCDGKVGCGVVWENVSSEYLQMEEALSRLRPDLNVIPVMEFFKIA